MRHRRATLSRTTCTLDTQEYGGNVANGLIQGAVQSFGFYQNEEDIRQIADNSIEFPSAHGP